ncbi:MAG: glycine--tRNA ligase subunit beta [Fimbriimonadales bacterium]|nr:glycine--tRNA ligase subunit beta [Fimbriimonadales bacterium]
MPELLLEVGCEELPASFVRKAYEELAARVENGLREVGLSFERIGEPIGTPRRLIVAYRDVPQRQPDRAKEVRGPSIKAAYDADGNPTKALEGFCRGQGVGVADVRRQGDYVWATRVEPGRPTREVLRELLPSAITGLTFEKAMRWGHGRLRFARPIRWIVASFDGEPVEFAIESVRSGLSSRGHRFNHPEPFEARTLAELLEGLRRREVEPDPRERERRIREGARLVADGTPDLDPSLVEENVFLTEWPSALQGSFSAEFLELPEEVLVSAMAKHEKFFPVRDEDGRLTNRFVSIRNGGEEETVRLGNEWVLNARFNDARFFYEEDRKHTIEEFLEKTSGIVFQEKLGTVRQRAERLERLCAAIAERTGADAAETEYARLAGRYAKADLATGLVAELASLQGVVGSIYAERDGVPHPAACAIGKHYDLEKIPRKDCEGVRTALRLVAADQIDKLAGYLGLGLVPSGSSDPFALRRAATMFIETAWRWPGPFPSAAELLWIADGLYRGQGVELAHERMVRAASELFAARYPVLLPDARHDHLEAALLPTVPLAALDPCGVLMRTQCLRRFAGYRAFILTATRPLNILAAAEKKGIPIPDIPLEDLDAAVLDSEEGAVLAAVIGEIRERVQAAAAEHDSDTVAVLLDDLEGPINRFFDSTLVMAEDEQVRGNRLALLAHCRSLLLLAGDFSRLVVEGA